MFHDIVTGRRNDSLAIAARGFFSFVSVPYGFVTRTRNLAFDRGWKTIHRAAVPVISVGNLTLGGTGKTPCVEYLATLLRDELDRRPVILSRGYGSHDEALVLEENLPDVPHLQGQDRVAIAATAVEELEADVLLLDDGFQHRRLHRDVDIVLLDATRPIRHERMFPRGLLRETPSGLQRAHIAILTRCDQAADVDEQHAWIEKQFPHLIIARSEHGPRSWMNDTEVPLDEFAARPLAAFCGLGNPAAFRQSLERLGHQVIDFREYADHHPYSRTDVEQLRTWAAALPEGTVIATTQKDWVKLRLNDLGGKPLAALRIALTLTQGEAMVRAKLADAFTSVNRG